MVGTESEISLKRDEGTAAEEGLDGGGGATHDRTVNSSNVEEKNKFGSKRTKRSKMNRVEAKNKTCCRCKNNVAKQSFSSRQWKLPAGKAKCRVCTDSAPANGTNQEARCSVCQEILSRESYPEKQWKTTTGACRNCFRRSAEDRQETKGSTANANAFMSDVVVYPVEEGSRKCNQCKEYFPKKKYSIKQWKLHTGTCKECIARTHRHNGEKQDKQEHGQREQRERIDTKIDHIKQDRRCDRCTNILGVPFLSKKQWKSENSTCKQCIRRQLQQCNDQKKEDKKENKMMNEKRVTDPAIIKAKLSERVNILPPNRQQRQRFTFAWESSPISRADEKKMVQHVVVPGYYHRLTPREIQQLSLRVDTMTTEMTLSQAISLRSVHLQQKALERHFRLQQREHELWNRYAAGESVLKISRAVDGPPVNVFRIILAQMGYSKAQIKKCLRNPEREFVERERREFFAAECADIVSNFDHDASRERAEEFELVVQRFLVSKGVTFVTQKQLEAEQERDFGAPVLTPDFLILDELIVNGQAVKWLDAKAFYGANTSLNIKRVRKQMSKYIEHWGSGAIMFLQGFSEMLVMEQCAMLNARDVISAEEIVALQERIQPAHQS